MNLMDLYYPPFTQPPVVSTRRVYMDDAVPASLWRLKRQQPKRNRCKGKPRSMIADSVVPYLEKHPGSSIDEIAAGTGLNRKSIATSMPRLVNDFLVERTKGPRADGTMSVYRYWSRA